MEDLEEIYTSHLISGTLVICENEDDTYRITDMLEANDHCVGCCGTDVIRGDMIHSHLLSFAEKEIKVLVMTYASWLEHKIDIEPYVGHHNLLVTYGLDNQYQYVLMNWVQDMKRRGFLDNTSAENYHLFALEKETVV